MKNILITGGAGFIGSHLIKHFVNKYKNYNIFNLDALTYAGNLSNLHDIKENKNYHFIFGDINDYKLLISLFNEFKFDAIFHCAAESHVDRSINDPLGFVKTNVIGTVNLLEVTKQYWNNDFNQKLFYHISTDEVFGSLNTTGYFSESSCYDPRSPYSASKASSDHFVRAYFETYGLPIKISNCSNNYGPNQFPEKLIPLIIKNAKHKKPLPIYGDGKNIRDWIYVEDHVKALDLVFHNGKVGETYTIGGDNEYTNIDLVFLLCDQIDKKLNREPGSSRSLITFVEDRKGHDQRYAIDNSKINKELKWEPTINLEKGISITIDWYLNNGKWLEDIESGSYRDYYKNHYINA